MQATVSLESKTEEKDKNQERAVAKTEYGLYDLRRTSVHWRERGECEVQRDFFLLLLFLFCGCFCWFFFSFNLVLLLFILLELAISCTRR